MPRTATKPQISMDDRIVTNPALEEMLEDRQLRKMQAAEYRKADKKTKETINDLNEVPPYRIGRFIISRATTQARSVSFETTEGTRLSIKTIDED